MRLLYLFLFSCILNPLSVAGQLIPISDARVLPLGSTVTVNGIVTSGSEFGTIRYMQDGTGGIAIFSSALAIVQKGDNITVTGVTTEFSNLLEIAPVTSWTLNSSGDPDPAPIVLSPSQLNESNESMLVRINNVTFTSSGIFQSNGTYNFTSSGETGVVYIRSGHPLVGQPIPTSSIILYGINSQYGSQYQVLPRSINDFVFSSVIAITEQPNPVNISNSGLDINWKTDVQGNGYLRYGLTPALELGTLTGPVSTTNYSVNLSGAQAAEVYYIQAYSVSGSDTAFSSVRPFITASNSSGEIKVYFTRGVNNSVAQPPSNLAVTLPNAFDDTLKAYIDRAIATLDIAIYSFDDSGTALIVQAINDAWNRGVIVRLVVESGNANAGLALLDPAIPIQLSPSSSPFYYGIMHNKFFVIDAAHSNPDIPVVMTGSTNWSSGQLTNDRNNLVFVQDQGLAKVYTMEFEEMWGGSGNLPVPANAKFGPDKSDNTPHILSINGKKVESYFSPTDNTNNQLLRTIGTADTDIYFATMVFTRFDLAYGIEDRVVNHGISAAGIVNDSSGGSGVSFQILAGVIGNNMLLFDHPNQTGIMHHKYMIVDHGNNGSDPMVATGSHNWSSAATQRNDENTIIIHDPLITNQFFQEFHHLFTTNGGALAVDNLSEQDITLMVFPNPSQGIFSVVFNSSNNGPTPVVIADISGRVVFETLVNTTYGNNEFVIDQQQLSSGIYFIKAGQSENARYSKIIIQ